MIKGLTSLRGIFILFIFFHHCLNLYSGGGTMAVTFFFVLGGFSMTLGYADKVVSPDFNYKNYLTRRFIKFYPLHWLCIIAVMPMALLVFNKQQIPILLANTALLQSWVPIKECYFSFNWVSWYLADTMFFTVAFPFLCRKIVLSNRRTRLFIALTIVALYTAIALVLPKDMYHAILYVSPYIRLTDFVFGIYLALFYLKIKDQHVSFSKNGFLCQLIIITLIVILVIESCVLPENYTLIAPVYWPLVGGVILLSSLYRTGGGILLGNKFIHRLGELSFIVFMIHQIILRYTTIVFEKLLHIENSIIYISYTLLLTIALSLVVERYLLNPITKWLTKKIQPSMTVLS